MEEETRNVKLAWLGFAIGIVVSCQKQAAWAQSFPFAALGSETLPTTFQIESAGPTFSSENPDERAFQLRGDALIPLAQSDVDAYAIQIRGSRLTFDRDHATGPAAALMPRDLGSIAIGPFGRRKLESGDIVAGDLQVVRSGIRLGSTETATTVASSIFWSRKKENDSQWLYVLSYSNSRSTFNNIPLPGFAYLKHFKNETSQGLWVVGLPFLFAMVRSNPWSFTSLVTPFTSYAEVAYSIAGPFAGFARFGWQPQGFKVSGGPREHLLFEEFRTTLGFRGPLSRQLMASIGVSYSDGRRLVWGDSLTKATDDELRFGDEINLFLSLAGRF